MKHLPLIAVAALLVGCDDGRRVESKSDSQLAVRHKDGYQVEVHVITVDSCQYVVTVGNSRTALVHKGNCTNHVRIAQ